MPAPKPEQLEPIEIINPLGLSLKVDVDSRDPASWSQLDNFDHFIDGSLRKILPSTQYGITIANVVILNFINWRMTDSDTVAIVGLGTNGKLYNLTTGVIVGDIAGLATTPVTKIPFLSVLPGTLIPYTFKIFKVTTAYVVGDAVIKYCAEDGNLYIYSVTVAGTTAATEPVWPINGSVVSNTVTFTNRGLQSANIFKSNYLVIVIPGEHPLKWDGTTVTQIGVSSPHVPLNVAQTATTPNLNGYAPIVGAFYSYCFYNPKTLHESSPAPIVGQTNLYAVDQTSNISVPGSFLGALSRDINNQQNQSYQRVRLDVPVTAVLPAIGQGFTHIRFYRSKDGGATYWLLTQLYNSAGVQLANSDGSITLVDLVTGNLGYAPLPTPQIPANLYSVYEGYGVPNLVPGASLLGPLDWADHSGSEITLIPNAGQEGGNAFQYVGTGIASGSKFQKSIPITGTAAATYFLRGYIDATNLTAGTIEWRIVNGAGAVKLSVTQAAGVAGFVTGSATLGDAIDYVEARINGTVTLGEIALWSNPSLQLGVAYSKTGYPSPDSSLVMPSPAIGSSEPPPISEWGAIYGGSLYLEDEVDKTRIVFSQAIDFEAFGVTSYLRFPSDTADPITTMLGVYDRLVIGKLRSLSSVVGSSATDFTPQPIDPQHGILGKRAIMSVGSSLIGMFRAGVNIAGLGLATSASRSVQVGIQMGMLLGDVVQPLTKLIPADARDLICFAYDTDQEILLIAFQQNGVSTYNDTILLLTLHPGDPHFANMTAVPGTEITTIREIEFPDGTVGLLAAGNNNKLYRLFSGTQDGTITATAITQRLPMPSQMPRNLWGLRKVFKEMWTDGTDLSNFRVSWSVDGGSFTTPVPLQNRMSMGGREGNRLQIKFTHAAVTANVPLLTYINVDWDVVGKSR